MPEFEVFTKRRGMIGKEPAMTLQASGGMGFNEAAFEALGKPKAVELLFDRTAQIIGVRRADPAKPHAYPVRPPSERRDKGFLVSGRAFVKFYDIEVGVARRWKAYMEGDTLCVDLRSPSVQVFGPRSKAAPEDEDADVIRIRTLDALNSGADRARSPGSR